MNLTINPVNKTNYAQKPQSKAITSTHPQNISFGDSFSMIKPEGVRHTFFIFKQILKNNFKISSIRIKWFTPEKTKGHYAELRAKAENLYRQGEKGLFDIYKRTVKNMLKGPVIMFKIKGDEAEVLRYKTFVGATKYKDRKPNELRTLILNKEIKRLKKNKAGIEKINTAKDQLNFIHASDTNYHFRETNLKNYDWEINYHYPSKKK